MDAILKITDGTTEINLLSGIKPGFHLKAWNVSIPSYKGGGTFQESSLSDGRQLVDRHWDNISDVFVLGCNQVSVNTLIYDTQELRRLLEKAASYWVTDWQNEPVWVVARAQGETNTRSALIYNSRLSDDSNPYVAPFLQPDCEAVHSDLNLAIEHGFWSENVPGTGTAVKTSSVITIDGRTLGNVDSTGTREPTSANENYIVNSGVINNLTDIYVDDGGVFSANLLDAALPYNLLPAVPAVNDACYFGCDENVVTIQLFSNLVFDIGTAGATYQATWEYWNGAWVALTTQDNTNASGVATGQPLDTTGVNSVHWELPSDWTGTTVNGITGFWIRVRVTVGGGNGPTQQNRNVYSSVWPYIEIQSTEITGDIQALAKIRVQSQSHPQIPNNPALYANRIIAGLRSVGRGEDFTAYLNWSNLEPPTTVFGVSAAGTGSFVLDSSIANRQKLVSTNPGVAWAAICTITLTAAGSAQYDGKFRCFIRGKQTSGGAGDVGMQLRGFTAGNLPATITPTVYFESTNDIQLLDFGTVEIRSVIGNSTLESLEIQLWIQGNSASDAEFYDLILMPVDEYACDSLDMQNGTTTIIGDKRNDGGTYLLLDDITSQKETACVVQNPDSNDEITAIYSLIAPGKAILPANARQRLWFLASRYPSTASDNMQSEQEISFTVQLEKQSRYLSMRGAR